MSHALVHLRIIFQVRFKMIHFRAFKVIHMSNSTILCQYEIFFMNNANVKQFMHSFQILIFRRKQVSLQNSCCSKFRFPFSFMSFNLFRGKGKIRYLENSFSM